MGVCRVWLARLATKRARHVVTVSQRRGGGRQMAVRACVNRRTERMARATSLALGARQAAPPAQTSPSTLVRAALNSHARMSTPAIRLPQLVACRDLPLTPVLASFAWPPPGSGQGHPPSHAWWRQWDCLLPLDAAGGSRSASGDRADSAGGSVGAGRDETALGCPDGNLGTGADSELVQDVLYVLAAAASVTTRRSAIWRLVSPCATSTATSSCREVSELVAYW